MTTIGFVFYSAAVIFFLAGGINCIYGVINKKYSGLLSYYRFRGTFSNAILILLGILMLAIGLFLTVALLQPENFPKTLW